ncbi:NADP-dependent oxidoreductase domain-containing protein [Fomitopsis serialis]|uniref:NADP-dependent oxidoreductase domain-containing protein n=1 Tax=Fomitopsis serialis TaxID=139415 RepID=UPI002008C602|nr:NADP-dependent oxidoreductase domain-containing protein [Neoantrodia serialis]KAH9921861.1 NADP-dependent oxidoreductase domain-containing protein [Neoantrodia serialis]
MSQSTYATRRLGRDGPLVSAIGFGAMGLGAFYGTGIPDEQAHSLLTYAADRGVTFWDTANIYGSSERVIGDWFTKTGRRSEIFLATKFSRRDPAITPGTTGYLHDQLEKSLRELKADYIDLYYQHRVDGALPIEVVLETLRPYVESGKIKYLGLSECSADHLRRARSVPVIGEKVIACQMEYSAFEVEIETDGLLATARELGVAIVAYSPLGRGMITGRYKSRNDFPKDDIRFQWLPRWSDENFPKNLALLEKFRAVANKYGATPGQAALAWILTENPDFVPIPGSRSIERLEENAKAVGVTLAEEDVKELRAAVLAAEVTGARYPEAYLKTLAYDSVPLSEWKGE